MAEQTLTGYPSIDKPWLKYYSEEAITSKPPRCSFFENIYNSNKAFPNDTALIFFGKKISYKTLFSEVERTAKAFANCGVKNGDNVAVCMPAVPETIYSILALNKLGANANMLNPTFTETQLTDRISETGASVLVVIDELYEKVENVIPNTQIKTVISGSAINCLGIFVKCLKKNKKIPNTVTWDAFIKNGKNKRYQLSKYQENKPAIMVYSSGTTGASKGIQLTNDGINATINEYQPCTFGFKRKERYFCQVPVWFSTGIVVTALVPLKYGVTVVLEPLYDFELFSKHIKKYRPNYLITATGLIDFMRSKEALSSAYKEFKYLCVGGEYVSPNAERACNEWLRKNANTVKLQKGYGMCECGGTVTNSLPAVNVVGSAGIPTPHIIVSAFDLESGEELTYGKRGEIRVLTPCRMLEYYKKPKETAERLHNDKYGNTWVCTGDMGYVAEDGNVYVCGRISDSYTNMNGEIIYLFDIEHTVLDIKGVKQCKVVSKNLRGQITHICHIVLDGKNAETVLSEIKQHCVSALPQNHQPKWIHIYNDALPVAPSGKLDILKMQNDTDELIEL